LGLLGGGGVRGGRRAAGRRTVWRRSRGGRASRPGRRRGLCCGCRAGDRIARRRPRARLRAAAPAMPRAASRSRPAPSRAPCPSWRRRAASAAAQRAAGGRARREWGRRRRRSQTCSLPPPPATIFSRPRITPAGRRVTMGAALSVVSADGGGVESGGVRSPAFGVLSGRGSPRSLVSAPHAPPGPQCRPSGEGGGRSGGPGVDRAHPTHPTPSHPQATVATPLVAGAGIAAMIAPEIGGWYRTIKKSKLTPPDGAFGPVWTTLYLMLGVRGEGEGVWGCGQGERGAASARPRDRADPPRAPSLPPSRHFAQDGPLRRRLPRRQGPVRRPARGQPRVVAPVFQGGASRPDPRPHPKTPRPLARPPRHPGPRPLSLSRRPTT